MSLYSSSTTTDYRSSSLRRSMSVPHINSVSLSSTTTTTTSRADSALGYSGSCSDLDQLSPYGYEDGHQHYHHHPHHSHHHINRSGSTQRRHRQNHKRHPEPKNGTRLVTDLRQLMTLRQHYYPEGGWGYLITVIGMIMQCIAHGLHMAVGVLIVAIMKTYRVNSVRAGWLGALSSAVALLISPITVALCKRKSTRVTAVIGGLVTALGCLFTSFASQFHQLFFSYATVMGVGVGMTRDCSTLMTAQYFKRRREFVEIFIVSGSGLGISIMSSLIKTTIHSIGWRLGLQAVTGVVFLTFILGTFYRSASLYHPQRRAILHLKNQRRKIKDKNKQDDSPPFFDFKTLKSKTVRILLLSTGICAFGLNTPIYYMAYHVERDGLGEKVLQLQFYLGLSWILGCVTFGMLVVNRSVDCRIARQYLCQTSAAMCGICTICFTVIQGQRNLSGYILFVWIYGIFCGGYHYSLKVYTFEQVRARNFARTWGFVQCSQSFPIAIGIPIAGYMNLSGTGKEGYYFSSACSIVGCLLLFFVDLHRRNINRHKHLRANGTSQLCTSESCPQRRKLSFSQEPDNEPGLIMNGHTLMIGSEIFLPNAQEKLLDPVGETGANAADMNGIEKPELTCISEEIADMDLPDNLLDELDYEGDCITSCNKVENYLMLSEFENNLNANEGSGASKTQLSTERRRRKLSMLSNLHHRINEESDEDQPMTRGNSADTDTSGENPKSRRSSGGHGEEEEHGKKQNNHHHHHLWPIHFGHHNKGQSNNNNNSSSPVDGTTVPSVVVTLNGNGGLPGGQKRVVVSTAASAGDGKRSNCLLSVMDEASE